MEFVLIPDLSAIYPPSSSQGKSLKNWSVQCLTSVNFLARRQISGVRSVLFRRLAAHLHLPW